MPITNARHPCSRSRWADWKQILLHAEDGFVSLALVAMIILPLLEVALRRWAHVGISGGTAIVQHLVLIVGMAGAAIAARSSRLLALSTVDRLLPERWRGAAKIFSSSIAAAVTAFLALAALEFVGQEREFGKALAYGVPAWVIEAALPIGFGIIGLRLLWHSAEGWQGRMVAASVCIAAVTAAGLMPAAMMIWPALALLLIAIVLGAPAFVALAGVALVLFHGTDQPIASIPIAHYSLVTNPSLPTLPLFTLAGYFLAEGGAPKRLIRVFRAVFGQMRGGPAIVTAVVCAFFTSFTGASGITILALGGLLMPVLIEAGYKERDALGLVTGSGSIGMLLPPCLPLILYAIVARIPIEQMFLGGLLPGIFMVTAIAWWGIVRGRSAFKTGTFSWPEARAALWLAKWELMLPVVAFVALFSGSATPVEAAALTALYAFIVEGVIHPDLRRVKDILRVTTQCALLIGGVLLVLGVALGLTNYLVDAEITARAIDWTTSTIHSRWVFLLLLNLFLLIVGCVMDMYSAILIQVPVLVPLGIAYGIDPVHLGIIFLANMELGYLTPPVGLNLYLSSYRFRKPVPEVLRSVLPLIVFLHIAVLLITFVPALTTMLPHWLAR